MAFVYLREQERCTRIHHHRRRHRRRRHQSYCSEDHAQSQSDKE